MSAHIGTIWPFARFKAVVFGCLSRFSALITFHESLNRNSKKSISDAGHVPCRCKTKGKSSGDPILDSTSSLRGTVSGVRPRDLCSAALIPRTNAQWLIMGKTFFLAPLPQTRLEVGV
jgi:hypothetical protein